MKPQLQLVKQALAGPAATTPYARMVKVQDRRLWAYGGAFCISTPVDCPLEGAFNPRRIEEFFTHSDREGCSWTAKDSKLIVRHGGTEVHTQILSPETVPVLTALGRKVPLEEQIPHLGMVARTARTTSMDFRQCPWFQEDHLFAIQGNALCFVVKGFKDLPVTGVPTDALLAVSRMKSPMVSYTVDQQALQLDFADGTQIAARKLVGINPPGSLLKAFEGDHREEVRIDVEKMGDILLFSNVKDSGDVTQQFWWNEGPHLHMGVPGEIEVTLEDCYQGPDFKISADTFRSVLGMKPETLCINYFGGKPTALCGKSPDFSIVGQLTR